MSIILAIGLGLALICLLFLAIQFAWVSGAPYGWQDDDGYHEGHEPQAPAAIAPKIRRPS